MNTWLGYKEEVAALKSRVAEREEQLQTAETEARGAAIEVKPLGR